MKMKTLGKKIIRINLKMQVDDSYNLIFDVSFLEIAVDLKKKGFCKKLAIITDTNVGPIYSKNLKSALEKKGFSAKVFAFKAGEKNKTWSTCGTILNQMARQKYGKDSCIIALGGGVVGDVAAFIASVTRRGTPCIQIPTTNLAMVDSSIGGKTGVDLKAGKNLAGTICQPAAVYFNFNAIEKLGSKTYSSGLAEVVKYGVIYDKKLFAYLEKNTNKILKRERKALTKITKDSCWIKGTVIEKDPYETGLRMILNYGHTAGHAIEKLSNYALQHGEAISIGMMVAGRIAVALKTGFNEKELKRQKDLLEKLGLPTKIPKNISTKSIIEATSIDKKAKAGKARYCLPKAIGKMKKYKGVYVTPVKDSIVAKAIEESR